jgi:hypothetical protein
MREKTCLYKYEQYGNIRIAWTDDLDGGGSSFGRSFVPVTRHLFGKTGRAFEFCAGRASLGSISSPRVSAIPFASPTSTRRLWH